MTAIEIQAISYWRACHALRNPLLAPADRAMISDQLHALATKSVGRVRDMAERMMQRPAHVWPVDDGKIDFRPGAA